MKSELSTDCHINRAVRTLCCARRLKRISKNASREADEGKRCKKEFLRVYHHFLTYRIGANVDTCGHSDRALSRSKQTNKRENRIARLLEVGVVWDNVGGRETMRERATRWNFCLGRIETIPFDDLSIVCRSVLLLVGSSSLLAIFTSLTLSSSTRTALLCYPDPLSIAIWIASQRCTDLRILRKKYWTKRFPRCNLLSRGNLEKKEEMIHANVDLHIWYIIPILLYTLSETIITPFNDSFEF